MTNRDEQIEAGIRALKELDLTAPNDLSAWRADACAPVVFEAVRRRQAAAVRDAVRPQIREEVLREAAPPSDTYGLGERDMLHATARSLRLKGRIFRMGSFERQSCDFVADLLDRMATEGSDDA